MPLSDEDWEFALVEAITTAIVQTWHDYAPNKVGCTLGALLTLIASTATMLPRLAEPEVRRRFVGDLAAALEERLRVILDADDPDIVLLDRRIRERLS